MNTSTLPGIDLNRSLAKLTVDQLYELIPTLSGRLYCFPNKRSVYEISGVTRKDNQHTIHFSDSVLGIDHTESSIENLTSKMRDDLQFAINKIS